MIEDRLEKPAGTVTSVNRGATHGFSKPAQLGIRLIAGLGVDGDAHMGATVKHRSRFAKGRLLPNLRQVHLIHEELLEQLRAAGFRVAPGIIGENVTTRGLDLLGLPRGARLHMGASAVIEVTGLRNPCRQLDGYQQGLMAALLDRDSDGGLIRKAGIMSVVLAGGDVRPGDAIAVEPPPGPYLPLEPV
jgi:hypothetical protein